jgi:hypothetical protein
MVYIVIIDPILGNWGEELIDKIKPWLIYKIYSFTHNIILYNMVIIHIYNN